MKFKEFYLKEYNKDGHTAPTKEDAPLHDLSDIYPDDIYSSDAARLYGDTVYYDNSSLSIIHSAKNRPNKQVRIYRAVPDLNYDINKERKPWLDALNYFNRWKFTPPDNKTSLYKNKEYQEIYDKYFDYSDDGEAWKNAMLSKIKEFEDKMSPKLKINDGDWVTISKEYAIDHGKSNLNGKFKILTKVVKASQLYSEGNSIHEWGYNK